jgi:hypothetical protein
MGNRMRARDGRTSVNTDQHVAEPGRSITNFTVRGELAVRQLRSISQPGGSEISARWLR